MIDLNAEMSTEKKMVALVLEINSSDIYMEMALINDDIMALL